jgi:hypothetical protein
MQLNALATPAPKVLVILVPAAVSILDPAAYLKNGGALANAAFMANHASIRTTQLYDRRPDERSVIVDVLLSHSTVSFSQKSIFTRDFLGRAEFPQASGKLCGPSKTPVSKRVANPNDFFVERELRSIGLIERTVVGFYQNPEREKLGEVRLRGVRVSDFGKLGLLLATCQQEVLQDSFKGL